MTGKRRWTWAVAAMLVAGSVSSEAAASPGVEGTRNLSMSAARSSSFGSNGALLNPSAMPLAQVFTVEGLYQLDLKSKTHGVGAVIMDSLINPRISVGLGYLFMRGAPTVGYLTTAGTERQLELSRFGHEAFGSIALVAVKQWLSFGLKPKYQYTSLRYRDDVGLARNAHDKLSAFGLDASLTVNFAGWAAISVIGRNLTGNHAPAFTDERDVALEDVDAMDGTEIDYQTLPETADYPITVEHGLAVFPLHSPNFSLNFDGVYDFTTYRFEEYTRLMYAGGAEYVLGPVPIRLGVLWDGRGRGSDDDRFYLSGGIAFVKPAKPGGVGVDAGFGFRQQLTGPASDTFLGLNIGIRIHPDL
jgi:hypothetical protein